ncbi:hypothetical protein IAU59_001487 [Kwoniella sp. CBS 9459]
MNHNRDSSLVPPSSSSSASSSSSHSIPSSFESRPKVRRRKTQRTLTAMRPSSPSTQYPSIPLRTPLSSALLVLTCVLACLLPMVSAAPPCLRFADYDSINQMFIDGGPGTKVLLCPNKLYRLSGSIIFTAADQEIATYGYPTGSERAVLRVEGKQTATAIQGDCRRCARVSIKSLIIDGNRKKLGRMGDIDSATGLIVLGGNEGQSVKNCWVKNPRGFTAVHIREGDKLSCTGAMVDKNEIGPVGEEYDPDVDGEDPEMSPLGRPLADGVSIACRDSFVRDNTFYDNTDAAIVVYCSPGTLVHANHIFARSLSAMAGILLVDSTPFDGDYNGVVVKQNVIDAASRSIRVGIGIGATVWSDDIETIIKGGSVTNNGLKGRYMGYGIAAAGLEGWTIKGNWDEATHEGKKSARCFDEPETPDPVAFLYNAETIKESSVQPGFVDHEFQYIVCIDGMYDKSNPPKHDLPPLPHDTDNTDTQNPDQQGDDKRQAPEPNQAKPDPARPAKAKPAKAGQPNKKVDGAGAAGRDGAAAERSSSNDGDDAGEEAESAVAPVEFKTGSEVMDDILEHSQQRMLEAIDHLHRRVDILAANVKVDDRKAGGAKDKVAEKLDPALSTHLEKMQRRVEHLESSQRTMLESALAMRSSIQSWDQEMAAVGEWQYDILLDVKHKLDLHLTLPDARDEDEDDDGDDVGYAEINSPRAGVDHARDSEAHAHHNIEREVLRDMAHKQRLKNDGGDAAAAAAAAAAQKRQPDEYDSQKSLGDSSEDRESSMGWWIKVMLVQGIVGLSIWLGKRWWRRRRVHTKLL